MKKPAKKLTLGILALAFLVGLVGCFLPFFDMDKYTDFLREFSPFFFGMIASVGTGAVMDRIKENKDGNNSVS